MGTMAAALVRLLGAQGQEISGSVADVHRAVATRVFTALGPLGAPTRVVHDAISEGVHGAVRASFGRAGWLGGLLASGVSDEDLLASARGRAVVGAVLGLVGDDVAQEEPDLAWSTSLFATDGALVTNADAPASLPEADEVVVLLHGLCETELAWSLGSTAARPALPTRLRGAGRLVLLARMNTGRRPAALGADLAALLEAGGTSGRVVLVGHSMGGLVARAALRAGAAAGHGWVARCDSVVTLGTPHLGAPLEKAVAALVRAGAPVPEVAAITRWFEQRSAGIRDLRHGVDDDSDVPGVAVVAAPLPSHVRLHTVGAELPRVGPLFGDGLVRRGSAHGQGVRRPVIARRGERLHVEGSHFDLLTDPRVTELVVRVVGSSPALEGA